MSDRRLQRKLEQETRLPDIDERPRHAGDRFSVRRSGLLTASLLLLLLLAFGFVWRAHQHAQFHQLTAPAPLPPQPVDPLPGGQDPAVMTRMLLQHKASPEFAGATVLPGLGMQVLQLTVDVPNRGIQSLLAGPSLSDFATNPALQPDAAPFHLTLPSARNAANHPEDIIAGKSATTVSNQVQADGGEVTGTFAATNASGHALGFDAIVDTTLTGRYLTLDARLHNSADHDHTFSFDWSPRFRAPNGSLSAFVLSVPAEKGIQTETGEGLSDATLLDFASEQGSAVPDRDLDITYTEMKRKEIGDGPVVFLTDRQRGLVLRFVLLTPTIRTVRVRTDAASHTLTLNFGTDDGATQAVIGPGQSREWRVRLEVGGPDEKSGIPTTSH